MINSDRILGEPLSAFAARKARQQNAHAGAGQSQLTPDSRNEKSQNIVTEPQRFESTVRPIKKRRIKHDRLDAINSAKTEREAAPAVRTSQGEDSLEAEDQSSGPENAAATKEEVLDSSGDETTRSSHSRFINTHLT